ncbi:FkbM family methyltransferase [Lusitaniella coriacea LEGE 07157]|uniref:FkbM family methyltransferase n=1 Tax=Lusitaniella coriacea LEGE 07157 TaxID=945747 RepID=A0A8J7IUX3_9CYAN|nr:FkbM family methyltransferase [Lusitaniella coriacea]MBE9116848.1 FkbM family methyltransferase [Lusitaniella coriacea LEGE 07157]
MKLLKGFLKTRLAKALAIPSIQSAINQLDERLQTSPIGMQYWYEENFWEPTVQLALRDLCKPSSVAFDVGANFGGLSTLISRLVGPKGVVCSFEASPRIVDKCQRNLILNGCNNTQLYHAAIYHTSHQTVSIYAGSHLNDSIYPQQNTGDTEAFEVQTLALDDFIDFTGLVPDVLKMDIEGAEFDALKGMSQTLNRAKPHLILEQQPDDSRCLDFLRQQGYRAIDLNSYREITTAQDYPEGTGIRNTLFIHQDRLLETPYQPPFQSVEIASLNPVDFQCLDGGSVAQKSPLKLNPGRYAIDVDFVAKGADNEMMCGVKTGKKVIFRYHAYTQLLASSYRDWAIHLSQPSEIQLYFDFLNETSDETFMVRGAKVYQIQGFERLEPWLYC